jgi:hypothetical protein
VKYKKLPRTFYRHISPYLTSAAFSSTRLAPIFTLPRPTTLHLPPISLALPFPFPFPRPSSPPRCQSLLELERRHPSPFFTGAGEQTRPAAKVRAQVPPSPLRLFIAFFSSSPIVCWLLLVRFPCLFESGCTASCSRAGVRILPRLPNSARVRFASNVLLVSSNVCFSRPLAL